MIRSRLVALETVGEDGFLRAVTKPLPEYSMHVGVFIIAVGWPLTSEDAGNMDARRGEYGGRRRGTHSKEMGKKTGMDHSMSEVALHGEKFVLGAIFGISKLHLLPLHIL